MRQLKSAKYDPTPNLMLRDLGFGCYLNDTDAQFYIHLPNGRRKVISIFDWKHHNSNEVRLDDSLMCQIDLADDLRIPIFIGLTWTKDESREPPWEAMPTNGSEWLPKAFLAPEPTIHLIPGNKPAESILAQLGGKPGIWAANGELVQVNRLCQGKTPGGADWFREKTTQTLKNKPKVDNEALARIHLDPAIMTYSRTFDP